MISISGYRVVAASAMLAVSCIAQAAVINTVIDTDSDGIPDSGGVSGAFVTIPGITIPGQAANSIQYLTAPAIFGTGFGAIRSSCLVALPDCNEPAGLVDLTGSFNGNGLTLDAAISAGGDLASSSLRLTSSGSTTLSGFTALQYSAYEYQQLRFDISGSNLPSYVPVDIVFSISSSASAAASIAPPTYTIDSAASVGIIDLATWQPGLGRFGSADLVFVAAAQAGTTSGPSDALTGMRTVLLRPNTTYGVQLSTSQVFALPPGTYSGLDLSLTALSDPVFSLNQDWAQSWIAAGNTDLTWSATRVLNGTRPVSVSEPTTLPLLFIGLAMMLVGFARRTWVGQSMELRTPQISA